MLESVIPVVSAIVMILFSLVVEELTGHPIRRAIGKLKREVARARLWPDRERARGITDAGLDAWGVSTCSFGTIVTSIAISRWQWRYTILAWRIFMSE
ncbi:MAG: hypothetical protein IPL60_05740 [Ardenticatenia bacterium]|nr:hypothetical protein [Ardenticatenia bacterium]